MREIKPGDLVMIVGSSKTVSRYSEFFGLVRTARQIVRDGAWSLSPPTFDGEDLAEIIWKPYALIKFDPPRQGETQEAYNIRLTNPKESA